MLDIEVAELAQLAERIAHVGFACDVGGYDGDAKLVVRTQVQKRSVTQVLLGTLQQGPKRRRQIGGRAEQVPQPATITERCKLAVLLVGADDERAGRVQALPVHGL